MRRTQLYLDEDLWQVLHARAKARQATVSELVREAVRERYLGNLEQRRKAMLEFVGSRAGREDEPGAEEYVRRLRRGGRTEKLPQP